MPQWIEVTRSPEYSPKLIGQELVFLQNDFQGLLSDLGDVAFMDKIEKAMLGETIIIGGYLNTQLIAAKSIFAEHLDVESLSAVSANLGTITSGSLNIGNGAFKVSSAGKLEATGADISGKITATSGTIGNWIINYNNDGALRGNGSDGSVFIIAPPDSNYLNLLAVRDSTGVWKTEITKAGVLRAQGADISGKITATSGTIGNWIINYNNDGSLRGNGSDGSVFIIAPPDSNYLNLLAVRDSTGVWKTEITKAGVLRAQGANISGTITSSAITSSTITGGTITGALIKTSAAGNRIELADNKLTTYMDNVKRVQLDFDRVSFYDDRGNIGGGIGAFFNSSLNQSMLSIFNDQGDIRIRPKIVNDKYVLVNINSAIPQNLNEPSIDIQTFNSSSERLDVFIKPTNFSINTYVGSMLHFTKDGLKVSSKIIPYTVTSPPVGVGSVGTNDYFWYSMYAASFVNKSERAIKEDIKELDTKALYEEVKNIKPYSFKYIETTKAASQTRQKNKETKETEEQKERMGIIAEEAPEKILDESGTGIDLYAYITLLLGALQESMNKIEQLEEKTKELSKNGGLS